jgi:hypothetical protein
MAIFMILDQVDEPWLSLTHVVSKVGSSWTMSIGCCFYGRDTTKMCNSTQKENVNLGWEKHIPNFTENGQMWKTTLSMLSNFFFLQTEQKLFLFILETLGDFAKHAQFCPIFITGPFCWKKLTFCLTQTWVFSLGKITNVCSERHSEYMHHIFL